MVAIILIKQITNDVTIRLEISRYTLIKVKVASCMYTDVVTNLKKKGVRHKKFTIYTFLKTVAARILPSLWESHLRNFIREAYLFPVSSPNVLSFLSSPLTPTWCSY